MRCIVSHDIMEGTIMNKNCEKCLKKCTNMSYEKIIAFIKKRHDDIQPFQHNKFDEGMRSAYCVVLRFISEQEAGCDEKE